MKYLLILFIAISFVSDILPQDKYAGRLPKTVPGVKITKISNGIYKIERPFGQAKIKNFGDYPCQKSAPGYDTTVIGLVNLDTSSYYEKYKYWQEVSLSNDPVLVIGNFNTNGKVNIIGKIKEYNTEMSELTIKELNNNGTFDQVYQYDLGQAPLARNVYDIDGDGSNELHITRSADDTVNHIVNCKSFFYKRNSINGLPTELSFAFNPFPNAASQMDNTTFGDFDKDGRTDEAFINIAYPVIYINSYNPFTHNFDTVYNKNLLSYDCLFQGFAINDFDGDGKQEIVCGSINGKVVSVKADSPGKYRLNWSGSVETHNAFLLLSTNDLDKNGKPELWVGGDAFYNGKAITRITIFEADSIDSYKPVGRIDLLGVVSASAFNIEKVDVDNDGTDEVMLCIGNYAIILKFCGSPGRQKYSIYYAKIVDNMNPSIEIEGATMYDITGNGKKDILVNCFLYNEDWQYRLFNIIFKDNTLSNVYSKVNPAADYKVYQNYPNPFNSTTNIHFELNSFSKVEITACNILGKEVAKIIDENYSPGSYTVRWETGSNLCSGVYLIKIKTAEYSQVIKSILLK